MLSIVVRRAPVNAGRYRLSRHLLALAGGLLAALTIWPVYADGGHDHSATAFDTTALSWGILSLGGVLLVLFLSRMLLLRQAVQPAQTDSGDIGYLEAISHFSRNAKLFLSYSLLAELGSGIWSVMFNLYLLRAGFPITFIGTFWLVNMLCHGAAALPAGLIADRYGRRRAFFVATAISLVAQGSLLFFQEPAFILVLAAVAGFGEAFHGVTGAPFMMENSEPAERPHLFSLNACFLQLSRFGGNLVGGVLPLAWAVVLGIPEIEPSAARWALMTGLPLTLLALLPLAFMREKPVELVASFRELVTLRNVTHLGIIARFTLLSVLVGAGFGLTTRFFNIFFQDVHNASDSQVGTILAFGAVAGAGSILISPIVAQQWGKARGLFFSQASSVPFLLLMAVVPSLSAVTAIFLVRNALASIGQPFRNQLTMEFISARERGTTAGFTHTAFDLGGGVGAGIAGLLIVDNGFGLLFLVAALLTLVPGFLYYWFFDRIEAESRRQTPAPMPARRGVLSTPAS